MNQSATTYVDHWLQSRPAPSPAVFTAPLLRCLPPPPPPVSATSRNVAHEYDHVDELTKRPRRRLLNTQLLDGNNGLNGSQSSCHSPFTLQTHRCCSVQIICIAHIVVSSNYPSSSCYRRRKLHTRSLIGSCVCHQLKRLKQLQSREHSACRTRKTVPCGQTGNWKIMAVVNAEFMSSYVQFVS